MLLSFYTRKEIDMGCDTKGFVLTDEKNPHLIFRKIKWAIFEEIKRETGVDNVSAVWGENYTMPQCSLSDMDGVLTIDFKFAGEQRGMFVITSCDHDYSDCREGKKIILSLGAWGKSVDLIAIALRALSELGETFIWENDCEGDWKPITFDKIENKKEERVLW
jgi:hypothetical protein